MRRPSRKEYTQISTKHKTDSTKNQCIHKTHKENKPVKLLIDNTQAPSCKLTKFFNKRIHKSTQYIHHIEFTSNSARAAQYQYYGVS